MDQPPQRSWWSRHWLWVVPTGCLSVVLVCGGITTLIFVGVFRTLSSSDVATEAVARAKANAEVKSLLGEPIETSMWVSGNLSVNEVNGVSSGKADLAIPLSGPKGSATLTAVATKSGGKWTYSTLEVTPKGAGNRIDLLSQQDQ